MTETLEPLEEDRHKAAAGWTRLEEGGWLPPGYGPIEGWDCGGEGEHDSIEAAPPRDSV